MVQGRRGDVGWKRACASYFALLKTSETISLALPVRWSKASSAAEYVEETTI